MPWLPERVVVATHIPSETSKRAGASGTRDEVGGGDDGEDGEGPRATLERLRRDVEQGQGRSGRAIRARRRGARAARPGSSGLLPHGKRLFLTRSRLQ